MIQANRPIGVTAAIYYLIALLTYSRLNEINNGNYIKLSIFC